jgi:hypothetical protein
MAKDELPSLQNRRQQEPREQQKPVPTQAAVAVATEEPEGYLPRGVNVLMNRHQAGKFKSIARSLEDRGVSLQDGTPVNNRRRVVLWMIENYKEV